MAESTKETLKQKFDSIYKCEQLRKDISQEQSTVKVASKNAAKNSR